MVSLGNNWLGFFKMHKQFITQRQGLASPAEAGRVNVVYTSHSLGLREKLMQRADKAGREEHGLPAVVFSHLLLHFALLTAFRGLNPIPQGRGMGGHTAAPLP